MKFEGTALESDIIQYVQLGITILVRASDEASFNLPAGWDTTNISEFNDDDKRLVFIPTSKRTYFLWLDIAISRLSRILNVSPDYVISTYILGRPFNNKSFTIAIVVNALYF